MIRIEDLDIEVEDADGFNDRAEEILTEFCEDLEKQGETRPITEDEEADESWTFVWSDKAQRLIEHEISRLSGIGMKYFDQLDIDISTYMYKEL